MLFTQRRGVDRDERNKKLLTNIRCRRWLTFRGGSLVDLSRSPNKGLII